MAMGGRYLALVSTHSRLKAAGLPVRQSRHPAKRFNTQPPEGGWAFRRRAWQNRCRFNTQPPEGGWEDSEEIVYYAQRVSTHSRLKAAGFIWAGWQITLLSFNTQPPEGGWFSDQQHLPSCQCFNTQPPEGGWVFNQLNFKRCRSFNTQPPEGGWFCMVAKSRPEHMFQHTAA